MTRKSTKNGEIEKLVRRALDSTPEYKPSPGKVFLCTLAKGEKFKVAGNTGTVVAHYAGSSVVEIDAHTDEHGIDIPKRRAHIGRNTEVLHKTTAKS